MVGDASGTGFGTTKWKHGSERIGVTHGAWDELVRKKSSNFREAYNLVLGIEKMAKEEKLKPGTELFVFTDNSTSERAFDKGTSKSRTLHALGVRLRKLQMEGQLFINFVWISGNRMINQGTDSLSRGDLTNGVMQGDVFLKHIPLNEALGERHDLFLPWLKEALPGEEWRQLEPQDWFDKAFEEEQGKFIWTPPPAIGCRRRFGKTL
jgi:hypothetical protein